MYFSNDMKELIELFETHKIEYALVGGFAVNFYGYVRTTQDIDFLIYPSIKNSEKMQVALQEFGFGDSGIPGEYLATEGSAIHIGVEHLLDSRTLPMPKNLRTWAKAD